MLLKEVFRATKSILLDQVVVISLEFRYPEELLVFGPVAEIVANDAVLGVFNVLSLRACIQRVKNDHSESIGTVFVLIEGSVWVMVVMYLVD